MTDWVERKKGTERRAGEGQQLREWEYEGSGTQWCDDKACNDYTQQVENVNVTWRHVCIFTLHRILNFLPIGFYHYPTISVWNLWLYEYWLKNVTHCIIICILFYISGLLCTAAADKCLSSPCRNGATCLDHLGDYVCLCPKGPVWYMGKNCDELYDACIMAPCTNCTSKPGTDNFTCHCPDGFTGPNCTQDVDECQSNPCKGIQSYCVNGVNGYSCHCPLGSGGEVCQDNVTTCSKETCQNGGTCIDIPDTGHQCWCAAGYQGSLCEVNIDECHSEPCQNGAICKDGINAYQCFCVPGFQGYHCDLDINECASRPCQNNGTCVDDVDHYRCDCNPGFKGKTICIWKKLLWLAGVFYSRVLSSDLMRDSSLF